ncbi:MAG: ArnT family glycosyltransferase [Gammaproteobacteria bacterium]
MTNSSDTTDQSISNRTWLIIGMTAVAVAFAVGIVTRFYGIGAAPLATDEFYLLRSVEQVLKYGLPRYDCGGYYVRGLAVQYAIAPLLAVGVPAEIAGRIIATCCNLAAVPAVYLLARRAGGPFAAVVCLVIFLLSLWEIEFSRFARMYAAYQALFLWYVLFLLRATLDGDGRARVGVYVLSLSAPLVWEGGALLAVLNFALPLTSRHLLRARDVITCLVILAAVAVYSSIDFRQMSEIPSLPADFSALGGGQSVIGLLTTNWPLLSLPHHPVSWLPSMLVLAIIAGLTWRYRRAWPDDPRACGGLLLVTLLFAGGLIGPGFGLLLLGLLAFADHDVDAGPLARGLVPTILLACLLWSFVIAVAAGGNAGVPGMAKSILVTFMKYPNVIDSFAYPWLKTMPLMTAGLVGLLGISIGLVLAFRRQPQFASLRFLLLITIALILMVGIIPTKYHETRYFFFLYPVLIVIAASGAAGIGRVIDHRLGTGAVTGATCATVLLLFAISADFNLKHMRGITEPAAIYRQDLPAPMRAHLYVRSDFPSVGRFLNDSIGADDLVIAGDVAATRYLRRLDAVYIARESTLFPGSSCKRGTIERWTNAPLLSTTEQFRDFVTGAPVVWMIVPNAFTRAKIGELEDILRVPSTFTSPDGAFSVYRIPMRTIGERHEAASNI